MTEDGTTKSSDVSVAAAARQRRKRKWDQPAESLVSAGLAVSGTLPLAAGTIPWMTSLPANPSIPSAHLPGALPLSGSLPAYQSSASLATQSQSLLQNAATIVQKLNLPKIQDELIAREIVINDADPTIRYKLTKRQTQEEIQRFTGAIVITRGKYRPPNGPPTAEKPLYLHISAGSHLKDTAERIKVVDQAASMVEEILKQGHTPLLTSSNGLAQAPQPLSTCLFLGFHPDQSPNIAARIRGPNDQYINHIMNETGATVVLRGRGSGSSESSLAGEVLQPLHLYITSATPKSLEVAKALAENLLDTIAAECSISRSSSNKAYNAVPPPEQLMAGSTNPAPCSTYPAVSISVAPPCAPIGIAASSLGASQLVGMFNSGASQANMYSQTLPPISGGTSYSGYSGIYPQATPLQQVALVLRQATASTTSTPPQMSSSLKVDPEKRPLKRKFQELLATSKGTTALHQNSQLGLEVRLPGFDDSNVRNVSSMPPPRKFIPPCSDGMPPPPGSMPPPPPKFSQEQIPKGDDHEFPASRIMPPPPPKFSSSEMPSRDSKDGSRYSATKSIPPPPPKFLPPESTPVPENGPATKKMHSPPPPSQLTSKSTSEKSAIKKSNPKPVTETLLKLMEYGEEEDDDTVDIGHDSVQSNLT